MSAGGLSTDPEQHEIPLPRSRRAFLLPLVVPFLLVLLALLQSPGRITFDTDLGLALNPAHLLHRAFHLWSAEAGFGGVGDQTYGFLFPMGPFFALGHLAAIPDWLTQRLWCGLVLVVAYEGARRLTLRMISPHVVVSVLVGVAWALSPRMLTVVGPFSSEALPVALAPWLVLPLVTYLARDVRKAAWMSGLVVLFLGAVNAGATVSVLPIPLLYLATRTTSLRTRLRSITWWSAAVVLGSLWWVGPLLLLASYSPPFTDWVESARTTTDPVSALAALRDVTDWVAYVPEGAHGYWAAAWDLATSKGLALATSAVAVLGIAGLTSRRLPERRFLLLTALLGFTVLTLGHAGSPGSPLAGTFRELLDGPAVPFRNIYKFDPVLQLPLLLGFAHVLDRATTFTWPRHSTVLRPVSLALAAGLLAVCAVPAFRGDLRPGPGFAAVPSWWTKAADYVARDGVKGRTLVVPEATTGRYTWGRTIGEPLEALGTSPWAVRDQVPLTQAGNTRLVDAIEDVLASGRGSATLADVLARSGIGQLLVRYRHQAAGPRGVDGRPRRCGSAHRPLVAGRRPWWRARGSGVPAGVRSRHTRSGDGARPAGTARDVEGSAHHDGRPAAS
jgi:arabinofuranan 3-O-arabinosyltransferase